MVIADRSLRFECMEEGGIECIHERVSRRNFGNTRGYHFVNRNILHGFIKCVNLFIGVL
jgi:hypothetical protein